MYNSVALCCNFILSCFSFSLSSYETGQKFECFKYLAHVPPICTEKFINLILYLTWSYTLSLSLTRFDWSLKSATFLEYLLLYKTY